MTICNMSIEAGAKAGLIAPDDVTFAYLEGRTHAPSGAAWEAALDDWRALPTDDGATFDKEVHLDAADIAPARVLGHQPRPGRAARRATIPSPDDFADPNERDSAARALEYMGLTAGTAGARRRRRHRVHRQLHQLADRGPAGRGQGGRGPTGEGRRAHPGRARDLRGEGTRPRRRGSTRCSPPPGSTGGSRAARCAWR